jgi:hypothetical protein
MYTLENDINLRWQFMSSETTPPDNEFSKYEPCCVCVCVPNLQRFVSQVHMTAILMFI